MNKTIRLKIRQRNCIKKKAKLGNLNGQKCKEPYISILDKNIPPGKWWGITIVKHT